MVAYGPDVCAKFSLLHNITMLMGRRPGIEG
jgi:hypothetical protein